MSKKRTGYTLIEFIAVLIIFGVFLKVLISMNVIITDIASFSEKTRDAKNIQILREFLFFDIKNSSRIELSSSSLLVIYFEDNIVSYQITDDGILRNNEPLYPCIGGYFDVTNNLVTISLDGHSFLLKVYGGDSHG